MADETRHPIWGIAQTALIIIGVVATLLIAKSLFFGQGAKKDKKIDTYQEQAISKAVDMTNLKNQILTLRKSLRQEKAKVAKIKRDYEVKAAEKDRQVEEFFEINTLSKNLVETYFKKKWCLGSKCLMERITP